MKKTKVLLLGFVLLLMACTSEFNHHGKVPLVEVCGSFLYKEDVKASMPAGISSEDSLTFTQNYIKNWVEDMLLFQKAESNVEDMARIESLVRNYRKSLIVHSYQQSLVEQELTNELTEVEMKRFYEENRELFKVDETLVKGLFIKVPVNTTGVKGICQWYKMKDEESVDRLEKASFSKAVDYMYFYDRWVPATVVLSKLPQKWEDAERYLQKNRHVELKDTAYYYFFNVDSILLRGERKTFDAARNEIKSVMSNVKQTDFIRQVKDDLYKRALEKKEIKYYY